MVVRRLLLGSLGGVAALLAATPALAYQVRSGDTLWAISHRTGASVDSIAGANRLADPNLIFAGQELVIPGPPAAPGPAASGGSYRVQQGDTLWGISRQAGVTVAALKAANGLGGDLIRPGQVLSLPGAGGSSVGPPPPPSVSASDARALVAAGARRHGLEVAWVMAIAHWESGFNQSARSSSGAIGLMQVEPATGSWAGQLAGRRLDLNNPADNVEAGTTILRRYLDEFHGDERLALAAYYQGYTGTHKYGVYDSSRRYVDGILLLRNRYRAQGV